MTGFGRTSRTIADKTLVVEIRSLNSKFTDMRFKFPPSFRERELELRRIITDRVERGKIDVLVEMKAMSAEEGQGINHTLFRRYHRELAALAAELSLPTGDMMQAILRIPNVVSSEEEPISDQEWERILEVVQEALEHFDNFRRTEGAVLSRDLQTRSENILRLLTQVPAFEAGRIERVRQRLSQNLEEFLGKENVDENRFEQEVLFYIEKMDITEEKVRLEQHCKYFIEQLLNKETLNGRKLSFISQEMGREINTLGAKAYSADIQRLVVDMKDELEKIKEQVANLV